jgi:hypothetical protein
MHKQARGIKLVLFDMVQASRYRDTGEVSGQRRSVLHIKRGAGQAPGCISFELQMPLVLELICCLWSCIREHIIHSFDGGIPGP